jgi:TonB family protein
MVVMRYSRHLLATYFVASLLTPGPAPAQKEITKPATISAAKTIYFQDRSGADAVGQRALAELTKWGRFQIVQDRNRADLILVLDTDPQRGGNLLLAGGQTATIDSQGHVAEDPVPNYNKQSPVRYSFLSVLDAKTGNILWSDSHQWGGLLTGFDSAGERLIKEFEKQVEASEKAAVLKTIKTVNPTYPDNASKKHIHGTVTVRIIVDKNGNVSSAKAISGPGELVRASEMAAKQWQFEPPQGAPITTTLEMSYGFAPATCPAGKKGDHGMVYYAEKLPMKTGHPGELQIVGDIDAPMPPYPEEAKDAGKEGDLDLFLTVASNGEVIGVRVINSVDPVIDDAAVATVRTWKFKVTHGEAAGFPYKILFRMTCDSFDEK